MSCYMIKNKHTIRRKACWITDDSYLIQTYISICSFLQWCDVPIVVYYYGQNIDYANTTFKYWINRGSVTIEQIPRNFFTININSINKDFESHIRNREVRFYAAGLSSRDLAIYCFDSDTVFGASIVDLFNIEFTEGSQVYACVEHIHTIYNKIFFERYQMHKSTNHFSLNQQITMYKTIYGERCVEWLNNPQYNNGVLIFYDAKQLASCWYTEYLKGLRCKYVNPGEDQVPLVSALYLQKETKIRELQPKFNSKGQLNGNYAVYHATSGQWRGELINILLNIGYINKSLTDYALICKRIVDEYCDRNHLVQKIIPDLQPTLFHSIEGFFFFSDAYTYLFDILSEGNVFVEVGTYKGKSICYMAEMVKLRHKKIRLFSVDNYSNYGFSNKITFEEATYNLANRCLDDIVTLVKGDSVVVAETFDDNSIDCVFLDGDHRYQSVMDDLSAWYGKLKSGGYLAGDDYTRIISVQNAVDDFCKKNALLFYVLNQSYIIKKP